MKKPKDFGDDFVTYDEAIKTIDVVFLEEAVNDEFDSITSNNT